MLKQKRWFPLNSADVNSCEIDKIKEFFVLLQKANKTKKSHIFLLQMK